MAEPLKLWSVTTLIKDALGTSKGLVIHGKRTIAGIAYDKPKILQAFVEDKDRDGAVKWLLEQEWAGLSKAAARGSDIHRVAEGWSLGEVVEYDAALEGFVTQYRRFLEDFKPEFLMAEAPVYNLQHQYAGTLDGIAIIDGKRVVVDIKTTAHGPNSGKSRPPFPEVALQLTLYRHAELVGLLADRQEINYRRYYVFNPEAHTEPMPETDGGVCVVVSPEDYLVVPVDTSERVWKACRHMMQVARFQTETSKIVFGSPLSPGVVA